LVSTDNQNALKRLKNALKLKKAKEPQFYYILKTPIFKLAVII